MATTYTTVSGDMWDGIAYKQLGSEMYIKQLMEANTAHLETVIFPAGISLTIPDVTDAETIESDPPWA